MVRKKQRVAQCISIYPKECLGDAADDELPWLLTYLLQLKDAGNVRTIEKRNWRNRVRNGGRPGTPDQHLPNGT